MAAGDFLDLQNNLAQLAGRASASDLDEDLNLCKQVINEAQLECYRPVDGRWPEWARRRQAIYFPGPVNATLGVTQGSRVVTGHAFPASTVGSVVAIGSNFYTYAGQSGSDHLLVEPVMEPTGSYAATMHNNVQVLDVQVALILGAPDRMGFGPLSPMTDLETELKYRSNIGGDFQPRPSAGYYGLESARYGGSAYPVGDPLYYRVESEQLVDGAAIAHRFVTLPLSPVPFNVSYRAQIFPKLLTADTDRPLLVADLVTTILLPIAREKWGVTYKKYSGENKDFLVKEGDRAREILSRACTAQSRSSGQAIVGRT